MFEDMTIKDRINAIIEIKGLTKAAFERKCGLSNGFINNIVKGVGEDKLEAILRNFPDINRVWLLTGEGEMLAATYNNTTQRVSGSDNTAVVGGNVVRIGNISGGAGGEGRGHDALRAENDLLRSENESLRRQNERLLEIVAAAMGAGK
nr:MAG TPA: LAMBDA REPRESSOR (TRIPLE MUTANT)/DNA COMPLEX-DNA COMPLEX, DOUBLE HELIX, TRANSCRIPTION-DNA.1A [Caudoviricetes sp.]